MRDIVKKWKSAYLHKSLYLIISMLLLAGCMNPAAYREPITRFQQASTVVIEGARTEYGLSNGRERDAVIDRLVAKRARIDLTNLNDPEMRLLGPDDLEARMTALYALAKHGQLLLTLASSDAPVRAKDAANSLDDAIIGLSSSLGKVPSDEFKNTAAGFAIIAAEAAKLALEAKINQALDKAIIASDKDVVVLIRLIRDDMSALHERRRNMASAARKMATDNYNMELKQNSNPEKLQKAAAEIKKAEDAWDSLPLLLGAGPGLDAMAQAHQKLVDYAKSSKTPQDLAELIEATDAFVTRAKVIADAIKIIREAKE
jgi:hypothetical protein